MKPLSLTRKTNQDGEPYPAGRHRVSIPPNPHMQWLLILLANSCISKATEISKLMNRARAHFVYDDPNDHRLSQASQLYRQEKQAMLAVIYRFTGTCSPSPSDNTSQPVVELSKEAFQPTRLVKNYLYGYDFRERVGLLAKFPNY
jgi:hypothetical protein